MKITSWIKGVQRYVEASFFFLEPLTIALTYLALGNPIAGVKSGARAFSLLGQLVFTLLFIPISEGLGYREVVSPSIQV